MINKWKKNKPGVLIVSVPKSGSIYIWGGIAQGLGLKQERFDGGMAPYEELSRSGFQKLEKGGVSTQSHILYNNWHRTALNLHLDRIWVQVRDPRMATLEWVLHLINLKREHDDKKTEENKGLLGHDEDWLNYTLIPEHMPEDYFSMSMKEKIDAIIEIWMPFLIKLVGGWLDAEKDSGFKPKILFTVYEEFVKDENAFWDKVLEFYEVDKSVFTFKPFTPKPPIDPLSEGEFHFRNARTDEWREMFTPEQQKRASEMIPDRLYKRFGWPAK